MSRELKALERTQKQWTVLGEKDPFWAILSEPGTKDGRWDQSAFFGSGADEIDSVLGTSERIAALQFGTALDFGCGVGRLSQALARRFDRVIGVDVSRSMLRTANQLNRFAARCEYVHNPATDLAFVPDESVDFVYSSITLQHIEPSLSRKYICEFFRTLRSTGTVVFQLPSRPRSIVWQFFKDSLPIGTSNLLWRFRTGSPEAMEAHFIPENEVVHLVHQCNARVVLIEDDQHGPIGWHSRRYFCLKQARKT